MLAKILVLPDIWVSLAPDSLENPIDLRWVEFLEIRGVQVVPKCDFSSPLAGLIASSGGLAAVHLSIVEAGLSLEKAFRDRVPEFWA